MSNEFRLSCGVAQRNLGYGYVSTLLEVLNIEPGYFCISHEDLMDKKVFSDRSRKATKKFYYRRNQLRVRNPVKIVKKKLRREKVMKLQLL